jgi:5-methylcytosine-specific restriction endonuclease McrA
MSAREKVEQLRGTATGSEIARIVGISRQRVHQILSGKNSSISPKKLEEIRRRKEARRKVIQERMDNAISIRQANYSIRREKIAELLNDPRNTEINITTLTGFKSGSRDRIRVIVRIRDNHTCQSCKKVWEPGSRRFDVHHNDEKFDGKSPFLSVKESDRDNIENMVTLCHKCHLNLPMTTAKMSGGRKTLELGLST